jgi:hypothetical protein
LEGLLPEDDNKIILDLMSTIATWHGLAKLRLYTDKTLQHLEVATISLGTLLRHFASDTCSHFSTKELPREHAARGRRKAAAAAKGKGTTSGSSKGAGSNPVRKLKAFNMNTYKLHSVGDYVDMIRRYGTTDSYSTQVVST